MPRETNLAADNIFGDAISTIDPASETNEFDCFCLGSDGEVGESVIRFFAPPGRSRACAGLSVGLKNSGFVVLTRSQGNCLSVSESYF